MCTGSYKSHRLPWKSSRPNIEMKGGGGEKRKCAKMGDDERADGKAEQSEVQKGKRAIVVNEVGEKDRDVIK